MNKDDFKLWGGFLLITIAGCIMGLFIYQKYIAQDKPIGNTESSHQILAGSLTDAKRMPQSYVFANTTTTDATYDGGEITQRLATQNADLVRLRILAVGSVSTSTLFIRQQISNDGTNFYNVTLATTTPNFDNATTTMDSNPLTRGYLIGSASTTIKDTFEIDGAPYVRFLFYGLPLGHLNLGVQAAVEADLINSN